MSSKKEFEKLLKIKGGVRGEIVKNIQRQSKTHSFQDVFIYIEEVIGKEKTEKFIQELKNQGFGYVFNKKIKSLDWYPLKLHVTFMLKMKEEIGWTDNDLRMIGYTSAKHSLIARLLLRHFVSIKKAEKKVGDYWKKIYSIGEISVTRVDMKNKKAILKIKDFKVHRIICLAISGYIKGIMEIILGKKNVEIKETKCIFLGDDYHEFELTWK